MTIYQAKRDIQLEGYEEPIKKGTLLFSSDRYFRVDSKGRASFRCHPNFDVSYFVPFTDVEAFISEWPLTLKDFERYRRSTNTFWKPGEDALRQARVEAGLIPDFNDPRHAQEHWLKLQAEAALKIANCPPGDVAILLKEAQAIADAVKASATDAQGCLEAFKSDRENALKQAAIYLLTAEFLHRRIVSDGG